MSDLTHNVPLAILAVVQDNHPNAPTETLARPPEGRLGRGWHLSAHPSQFVSALVMASFRLSRGWDRRKGPWDGSIV